MRVLFDALGLPPHGGAKSSALGWIASVAERGPEHKFLTMVSRYETALEDLRNVEQVVAHRVNRFGVRVWAQWHIPQIVHTREVDLVHFGKNLGCFGIGCPTVVTINDLNRLHYPAMFSKVDVLYWRTIQRATLQLADQVIAISENTKGDLMRFYGLPREKVRVIYPAVATSFEAPTPPAEGLSAVLQKYGVRRPYILSVGGMAAHKNVYTAVEAFHSLIERGYLTDYTFAIVGERFHTHNDQRLDNVPIGDGAERVSLLGVVEDEDLPSVYAGASLFVYPSLYEGFGIAPLEAMACGVPVLASRVGSLHEVLGEAAWLVEDATDVRAIEEGMLRILSDSSTGAMLRRRGLDNVRRFSWSATALQTLDLYRELVHDGSSAV